MYCNFVNTLFSRHERRSSMMGVAIGSIKARDEISEVVVVVFLFCFFLLLLLPLLVLVLLLLVKTKPLGRGSWTHLSLLKKWKALPTKSKKLNRLCKFEQKSKSGPGLRQRFAGFIRHNSYCNNREWSPAWVWSLLSYHAITNFAEPHHNLKRKLLEIIANLNNISRKSGAWEKGF